MLIDYKIDNHNWEEYESIPDSVHPADLQRLAYLRQLTPEIKEVEITYNPETANYKPK